MNIDTNKSKNKTLDQKALNAANKIADAAVKFSQSVEKFLGNIQNRSENKVSNHNNQHVSSTTISKEELRFINEMRKTSSQLNVLDKEQLQAGINQSDKAHLVASARKIINIHMAMGNEKDAKKIEKLLNPYEKNSGISNAYADDLINLLVEESIPQILMSPPIALQKVSSDVAFGN